MPGFVQDKLEIKILILYIAARVVEPIPFSTMLDLVMCDDGINYFDFAECLRDLVKVKNLTLSSDGLYAITEKGRWNGETCESSLAWTVRQRCDRNLEIWNRKLRRERQVQSSLEQRPNGTYTVRLALEDDKGQLLELKAMIPRKDMAELVCQRFRQSPERLYGALLDILLQDPKEEQEENQEETQEREED